MNIKTMICAFALLMPSIVSASEAITYKFDGTFEDAKFAVENSIINRGLVIDYTSHVGEMLNRTGADVGSSEKIFDEADIFIFCSAAISRQVMEQDPLNIVHCPYGIFITKQGNDVQIGHRNFPDGAMQAVEDLLSSITSEAISN